MGLYRYILKRFLLLVPVLIGATFLIFIILHLAPGDPARLIIGQRRATEETLRAIREQFNLNEPLWKQYGLWLWDAAHGDLGRSFVFRRPINGMILARYKITLQLALAGWFVSMGVGIPAGIISAVKKHTRIDYAATVGALLGVSMPAFWQGIMAIYIFAFILGVLPSSGLALGEGPIERFRHLLLPGLTLGTSITALTVRLTRSSMLEVLDENYIRTARAKGVPERDIIVHHALQNAFIPILTVVGLQIGLLMAGSVLTETVFGIGGMGRLLVRAVRKFDYPTVQAITLVIATVFVLVNLAVDILYAAINPKIRYD